MSTLARIRNRSGLLLVVIGVGMLAFIGGDFMSSLGSGGGGIYVGEVLGEDVLRQDYETKVEEGINNWKSQNEQSVLTQTITGQIRSQVWDQYVRELVMNNEYSKLGIDVSDDEFFELLPSRAESENSWTVTRAEIEAKDYDLEAVNPNREEEDTRTPEELLDIVE